MGGLVGEETLLLQQTVIMSSSLLFFFSSQMSWGSLRSSWTSFCSGADQQVCEVPDVLVSCSVRDCILQHPKSLNDL